jgi:hypothetical protein
MANPPWLEFLTVSRVYHYSMTDGQGYRHALAIGSDVIGLFLSSPITSLAIGPGSVRAIYEATTGQSHQTTRLPQLSNGV